MCRMIFAAGEFNIDWLFKDLSKLALDDNEKHEENANKEFKHEDGWGITYLDGNDLKIFRSINPIFDDSQVEQFKNLQTPFVVIHARRASQGEVSLPNVHPFEYKDDERHYVFFHNGTVMDELKIDSTYHPHGSTDSEKFFYYLLSGNQGQLNKTVLQEKLRQLKDYTSANFILAGEEKTFIAIWYHENPLYYTMKMLQEDNSLIIASEILPHYRDRNWQRLENHEIIEIDTSSLLLKNR